MATLQEQPQVQAGGPVAGQSSPGTGNSLTQISAGPAALAQIMIYEAMALYAKIIKLQAEQKINMVGAQVKATEAQSEETISEGKAARNAAIWAGAFTATSAVLAFGAYKWMDLKVNKNTKTDMSNLEKSKTPMDQIEKSLTKVKGDPIAGEKVKEGELSSLAKQFKRGEYKGAKNETETQAALKQLKNYGDSEFDFDEWEGKFRTELDGKNRAAQAITQRQNTLANYSQMTSQIVNSLGQGGSTIAQGQGSFKQKTHSAAAALDGTSSQIAGSASSDAGQAMGKATQSLDSEIQILEAIHRANSVN